MKPLEPAVHTPKISIPPQKNVEPIQTEEPLPIVEEPKTPVISSPNNGQKETPSLLRKKEVKEEVIEVVEKKETVFTGDQLQKIWKKFITNRTDGGAGDAEKLVLGRDLSKKEGNEISILLGSQLEMTILEKFEQDLVQYLRRELHNDLIVLTKEVKEQEDSQKLYTSQDKYDYMVAQNPSLKNLKDKLGLDFEY